MIRAFNLGTRRTITLQTFAVLEVDGAAKNCQAPTANDSARSTDRLTAPDRLTLNRLGVREQKIPA